MIEHQGAAETLGDAKQPSQLKVRFDDLYHIASTTLADELLLDTESSEGLSHHSPEQKIAQFLCRLFMETNSQTDRHFNECQMSVMDFLSVEKTEVEKDRQLNLSLNHCVSSLLAVSRSRNEAQVKIGEVTRSFLCSIAAFVTACLQRVYSRLKQTDADICSTDVVDKVREFAQKCAEFVWDVRSQPTPLLFTTADTTFNPYRHRRTYAAKLSSDIIHYHVWPTFVDESVNSVLSKGHVVT
jgi:hypothetical protein